MNTKTNGFTKVVAHTSLGSNLDLGLPTGGGSKQYPRGIHPVGGDVVVLQSDGTSVTIGADIGSMLPHCGMVQITASGTTATKVYVGY